MAPASAAARPATSRAREKQLCGGGTAADGAGQPRRSGVDQTLADEIQKHPHPRAQVALAGEDGIDGLAVQLEVLQHHHQLACRQLIGDVVIGQPGQAQANITFWAAAKNCSPSWVNCSTRELRRNRRTASRLYSLWITMLMVDGSRSSARAAAEKLASSVTRRRKPSSRMRSFMRAVHSCGFLRANRRPALAQRKSMLWPE